MSIAAGTLPAPLRAIREEVQNLPQCESNLDALQEIWSGHVSRAAQEIAGVHILADGEILYIGELSPGCRACKEGTWDCIFTTTECNLECGFCCSPRALRRDYCGSGFGTTPEQIVENQVRTVITGISFSGGEPFVDRRRLFEWVGFFRSRCPDKYLWVYTNGLLADAESVQRLREIGIDEIRFNMAATGYDHPTVMRNLAAAAKFIPNVTVEIPAIPEHASKLLDCLSQWSASGVRYLNLHELICEAGSNSATMPGARRAVVTPDGHRSEMHAESRALTLAVMRRVRNTNLPLSVNDCSLQSKLRQLRGRRRSLAPLVQSPHEKLVNEQVFESFGAFRDGQDFFFFHPDSFGEVRRSHPEYRIVRLVRTAPLSVRDPGKWIVFEEQ